ncbi:MAG: hypothetical protein AB2A00_30285 [Myxococcota bacterium]
MKKLLKGLMMIGLMHGTAFASEGPAVLLDESDETLELRAVLGDEHTFRRSVRLKLDQSFGARFSFLPSDLRQVDGDAVIDRSNITLVGEHELRSAAPQDFEVRISNVTVPGTYEGTLDFMLEGQEVRQPPRSFRLVAQARPELTLVDATRLSARRVRSGGCVLGVCPGAWLAEHLLPAELSRDEIIFTVHNPTAVPAVPTGAQVQLKGEETSYTLTDAAFVDVDGLKAVGPHESATFAVGLRRGAIPPERYSGKVLLQLAGQAQAAAFPVELAVREGPGLALFLMLLGIILGRMVKHMHDRSHAMAFALSEVRRVQQRIGRASQGVQEALLRRLDAVRAEVTAHRLDGVRAELERIEQALEDAVMPATSAAIPVPVSSGATHRVGQLLARLSGVMPELSRHDAAYHLARPMLYLLLLMGLVAVGMQAFYVGAGVTFGVQPLADYVGIMLWGLTADVTSRSVSSLRVNS